MIEIGNGTHSDYICISLEGTEVGCYAYFGLTDDYSSQEWDTFCEDYGYTSSLNWRLDIFYLPVWDNEVIGLYGAKDYEAPLIPINQLPNIRPFSDTKLV